MGKVSTLFVLLVSALALSLQSCQPTCTLPTQAFASVRLENAVTNVDKIDLYIDNKLFDQSFYDLGSNGIGTRDFGYESTFLADGSTLQPGSHHLVARRSSDAALLSDTVLLLKDHRQSLLYIGRMEGTLAQKPQLRYLDDAVRAVDTSKSLVRFVHAVSDMPGLDVYFHKSIQVVGGKPKPDLVLSYGNISDEMGGGTGTGKLPTDYFSIPTSGTDGLLVTAKGDTSNVVVRLTIPFSSTGFLATIVIRGQSQPVGQEHAVSTITIEDGQQSNGTYNGDFQIYGIRLANATRFDSLSLLMLSSPPDDAKFGPRSTRNTPLPLQQRVLLVPRGSIGRTADSQQYMPLSPSDHGVCDFWLCGIDPPPYSVLHPTDTPYHFRKTSFANDRYTFVGIDSTPLNGGASRYGVIQLRDTVSLPADAGFGRVRFVNASPDHKMNFTFGGTTFAMNQGDIRLADAKIGHYTVTVSDGAKSGTIDFDLPPQLPITIILLPVNGANQFPYVIAKR